MNKKLLGIAAVALLGVSAAFAATTSTVYFTASGTLTKYEEEGYGAVVLYTNILDSNNNPSYYALKKYAGEEVNTGNSCTATLIDSTKVTNNNSYSNNSSDFKFEYAYKGISVKDLNFSKKGDYVVFGIVITSLTNSSYYYNFTNSKKLTYSSDERLVGYSEIDSTANVSGTYKEKFNYRFGSDPFYVANPDIETLTTYDGVSETFSSTSETCKIKLGNDTTSGEAPVAGIYLCIELKEDVSDTTTFTDLTINLPEIPKYTD